MVRLERHGQRWAMLVCRNGNGESGETREVQRQGVMMCVGWTKVGEVEVARV
jgi:hypothetical protein